MRSFILLPVIGFSVFIVPVIAGAQSGKARESDPEIVPYHTHLDNRFGHDHAYPDRGAVVRELPKGAVTVAYAGLAYRFHEGVWFEPRGQGFMVVAPPIGLIVSTLPKFSTVLARHGTTFLYGNDTFYLPRPDVGGYEVVNDPEDEGQSEAAGGNPSPASALGAASPSWDGSALKAMDLAPPVAASAATLAAAPAPAVPTGAATPVTLAAVTMPVASTPVAGGATGPTVAADKALIYPKNGQSADQQARDRYECYRFGVTQSGFDPMHPPGAGPGASGQADFERAQGVCLDARGYAVR